jgi:hypothetical protein
VGFASCGGADEETGPFGKAFAMGKRHFFTLQKVWIFDGFSTIYVRKSYGKWVIYTGILPIN